jgi:hypothetical protein
MKNKHDVTVLKIEACNFENILFDDQSVIVNCILESEYKTRAMINNNCIDYSFIDIDIAHQVCEALEISFLKLNKSREVKNYDERRDKNISHVIYSFMIIQNHIESFTSIMITKLDQHSIILEKSLMKKHDVNYHDHDDSISFHSNHCSHLEASEYSYSKTKKEISFSKRNFSDQSKLSIESIEDKEIKFFLEKNFKILRRSSSQSMKFIMKRLIKSQKRLNERRRIDESWRKKLRKVEISTARILFRESRKNSFFDEISISKITIEDDTSNEEDIIEIYSIAIASFNILSRQKDVKIFVVFMKDLEIQLKKQDSSKITDSKTIMSFEYHDSLNVFFKKKKNEYFVIA